MSLKTRLTVVTLLSLFVVTTALIISGAMVQNAAEERFRSATIAGKNVLLKKIVSSQLDTMEANTKSLTRDRDTLRALKGKELDKLAENAVTTYRLLNASGIITRFQVVDIEGKVLFSEPASGVDKTSKRLVEKAIKEAKIERGVERDDNGELVEVLAFPLYWRGKPIGVGVYINNLVLALEDFKKNDDSDAFLISGQSELEYGTDKKLYESLNPSLPSLGEEKQTVEKLGDL